MAGHLLAPGSVFGFLAGHRRELFPEEMFGDLFSPGLGRPSVPAEVMASVLVLQSLHGFSDREAVEALTFDLRWKAACGYAVAEAGFHPTTLTYWRRRLAASGDPERIFGAVREVVAATGVLTGRTRRVLDSTVLDDAVATQDTVTQIVAAIRRVGREVPGAVALIGRVCTGHDYTLPGKPSIAWDDPDARQALVSALVNDANALLAAVRPERFAPDAPAGDPKAAEAAALLALVAGQDVEPAAGSDGTDGRWKIARKVAEGRVVSTVDPQARHAHKTRSRRQDGYKAHLVAEPDTGIITVVELTMAAGPENSDAAVGARLLAADPAAGRPLEVLADSAYGTGEMLAALARAGHTPVVKPWPLHPAVKGGFTLDDFAVDESAGTVTCPNHITRPISPGRNVTFGAACTGCPLRSRCTTSASGRKLTLHEHDALQREHRARARDPEFNDTYRRHRPMVERTIAWLTHRARRVPYRGTAKNNAWLHLRAAGLNLRRMLNLGLERANGTWAIP